LISGVLNLASFSVFRVFGIPKTSEVFSKKKKNPELWKFLPAAGIAGWSTDQQARMPDVVLK
jgi:hypothetical protein